MKKILLIMLTLTLNAIEYASHGQAIDIRLNDAETSEVRNQLASFENGQITLDAITIERDETWGGKLLAYYAMHSNNVTAKMKLPISRFFAGFGKYPEASKLAQEYVSVYSNDWRGWRILGGANTMLGNFSSAVNAYTNAVRLGDDGSCAQLAYVAMKIDQDNIVRDMLSHMIILKNSKPTKDIQPVQIAGMLMIYSLRQNQKDVFLKALEGLNLKDILAQADLARLANKGCKQFSGPDIDKIRKELEAATESNSSSPPTNALPAKQ